MRDSDQDLRVTGPYRRRVSPEGRAVRTGSGSHHAASPEAPGPVTPPARDRFPGVGGAIVLLAVLFLTNLVAGLMIVMSAGGVEHFAPPAYLLAAGYVFAFGATLWFGVVMSRSTFGEVLRVVPFPGSIVVPVLSVLFGLWVLLIESLAFITRAIPIDNSMMEEMSRLIFESIWVGVFLLVVAAPILEEALFRGIILRGLLERYSPRGAVILSAVFFSLAHFNIWQLPASFGLGLFLGWMYLRTRSLILCMMIHAFHNLALAFVGQYLASMLGLPEDVTEVPFLPWWILVIGVIFLVLGVRMLKERLEEDAWPRAAPSGGTPD